MITPKRRITMDVLRTIKPTDGQLSHFATIKTIRKEIKDNGWKPWGWQVGMTPNGKRAAASVSIATAQYNETEARFGFSKSFGIDCSNDPHFKSTVFFGITFFSGSGMVFHKITLPTRSIGVISDIIKSFKDQATNFEAEIKNLHDEEHIDKTTFSRVLMELSETQCIPWARAGFLHQRFIGRSNAKTPLQLYKDVGFIIKRNPVHLQLQQLLQAHHIIQRIIYQ